MKKRRYLLFSILSVLACYPLMASSQDKKINVTEMGARPNDGKDDTQALRRAVAYACEHPGTTLYFPKGIYELKDKEAITLEWRDGRKSRKSHLYALLSICEGIGFHRS